MLEEYKIPPDTRMGRLPVWARLSRRPLTNEAVERDVPAAEGRRLASIDAFRGIAALAVLLAHLPFSLSTGPARGQPVAAALSFPQWVTLWTSYGQFGVNLFLVLSGFCIHMTAARLRSGAAVDFFSFWRRRLHRLYPPYFATLVLTVAGLFVLQRLVGPHGEGLGSLFGYSSTSQFLIDIVLLVFLLQNLNGASARIGNGPFWSLALEEQLYLLYFPLLALRRKGWTLTLLITGGATLVWRFIGIYVLSNGFETWSLLGPARWFEWALGALAVEAYLGKVRLPGWCSSLWTGMPLLVLAGIINSPTVARYPVSHIFSDAMMGLAFFVLVNAACRGRWGESARSGSVVRLLARVGLFSYSLYLTHEVVIVAVKQLGLRTGLNVGAITVLRLVVPIVVAYIFYRVVESRFIHKSRRAYRSRRSQLLEATSPT